MRSNKSRVFVVAVMLFTLSALSVVLHADETGDDSTVMKDADTGEQAPTDSDITSDTVLGGSDGSTTPVTSIPPDTKPPSEDSTPTGDKMDSDEDTEYYKFADVQSPSSPIVEKSSFQTSLFTGAASYFYPLDLPKGTNGLTPEISLNYNSQSAIGRAGIAGLGWDLGLSYVERDVNYTPENFSDDRFVLVLNGERYDLVYVPSDGRYHTKIESYLFVNKSISAMNTFTDYWLVRSKDGIEYQFGFYNKDYIYDSEVVCSRGTYVARWYLDQVKDTHDNTINLLYNQSEGAVYPQSIFYSNKEIDFIFENRSDAVTVYNQGCRVRESKRIKSAVIKVDSAILRSYNFSYASDGRSLLNSITEYASNGSSLPATVFDYQSIQGGWQTASGWSVPDIGTQSRMGIRFVDVNNDGLVDIIQGYEDDGVDKSSAWLNNGSGWVQADNWKPPVFFSRHSSSVYKDHGVEFADFNADGLVDMFHMNSTSCEIWFNTGNGWTIQPNTSWPKPPGMGTDNLNSHGVRVADINGDGKVDILHGYDDERTVWINNGSGWYNASNTWKLPTYFEHYVDNYVVMTDLNGDGLIDLIKEGDPGGSGGIWLNNGSGWLKESDGSTIPLNLYNQYGIRVTDINGDDLPDILQGWRHDGTPEYTYHAWISNESGWIQNDTSWAPSTYFIDDRYTTVETSILSDLNGDGLIDIIDTWGNVYLNKGPYPGLLKSVHMSLGGLITINYTTSTSVNNTGTDGISHLGYPIWLVSSIAEDNGMSGAQDTLIITRYNYSGGLYDAVDKESRGFEYVNVTNSLGNYNTYRFYQDDSKKGTIRSVYSFDKNGAFYSGTENNWTNSTKQGGYYEVLLSGTTAYTFDGSASSPKSSTVGYSYDSYGNPVKVSYLGTASNGDEKYVTNTYTINTNKWILNKVSNTSLSYPESNVLTRTEYYYDNSTSLTTAPILGDVTKERHLVNGSYVEITYGYYSSGALRNVTDPLGHTTYYEYESTYTFPSKITNAKGQFTTFVYNVGTGNLNSSTDPNNYTTTYEYDVFGRIVKEIRPYDTSSSPSVNYTYYLDGIAPEGVKTSRNTNSSDTFDSFVLVDGSGRVIQTRTDSEDPSRQIVQEVFYNALGQVERQYVPYNSTVLNNYSTPAGTKYTNYSYDPAGRLNRVTNPDGNYSTHAYDHWKITVTDENGHQKNYYLDAYKRVVKVEEISQGSVYSTTLYDYDAKDNLVKITDTLGNVFSFGFDELGRKINMTDPDMGTWLYSYDNAGNLKTQRDNRNTLTGFAYDSLNRVIQVNYSDGSRATYYYDKDSPYTDGVIGTLTQVNESSGMSTRYYYDQRLRKINEVKSMDGFSWITNWSYDSMDRVRAAGNPDGVSNSYGYNPQGELNNITNVISNIDYNSLNKVTRKDFPSSEYTVLSYDPNSFRLKNILTTGPSGTQQNLDFGYDNAGNIRYITDSANGGTQDFQYDDLDRLTYASESGNYTHAYNYNSIGNMLSFNNGGNVTYYNYTGPGPHAMTSRSGALVTVPITTTTTTTATTTTTTTTPGNCPSGGIGICGTNYCCGAADNVCPTDFEGISCGVSDPDCGCSNGGISFCGGSFCCGVSDGVCPSKFEGVSCSTSDVDCN